MHCRNIRNEWMMLNYRTFNCIGRLAFSAILLNVLWLLAYAEVCLLSLSLFLSVSFYLVSYQEFFIWKGQSAVLSHRTCLLFKDAEWSHCWDMMAHWLRRLLSTGGSWVRLPLWPSCRDLGQVLYLQLPVRFGVKLLYSIRAVVGSASEW